MQIRAYNPPTDELEMTFLSQYHDRASTGLAVKNNQRFASTQKVLVGRMGYERTEIRTVSGTTDERTVTVDATKFPHNADDPIYVLDYDKFNIYRATAEDGSYSLLATVDIDVDNRDLQTPYEDAGGLTTHWYKISHYNSVTSDESDLSDPVQATGYPENSVGEVINDVVQRVRDTGYTVLDVNDFISIANEVNKDLTTQSHKPYRFQKDHEDLSTIAGQNFIDLPVRLWKFDYVMFSWTTGGQTRKYKPEVMEYEDWVARYQGRQWASNDELYAVALDEETNRLYLGPTPRTSQAGVVTVHFYQKIPTLTGLGSLFITPNNLIYRYKMMAEHFMARAESDKQYGQQAAFYDGKYGNEVVKMQRVNRVDAGTPRSFQKSRVPGYRRRYQL